ncbi:MAG: selenide, water dikinase SelD, partial [Solirubrobacteraceae bacterium]
ARILRNSALRPGDDLVLTKPLGTGVISTALKAGATDEASGAVAAMIGSMVRPNREAGAAALDAGAAGATDVTGFGLLGHLSQMARASGVDVNLDAASVPVLDGAAALAAAGHVPEGTRRNLSWVEDQHLLDRGDVDDLSVLVLADAQTSGGILFGAEPGLAAGAVETLRSSGHTCAVVGRATRPTDAPGTIRLR